MEATHKCTETVAILDAGSQYSKVIDRRIRELNVSSDIIPFNSTVEYLKQKGYKAIIISGGPESVYSPTAPKYDPHLFESGIPTLGICYGMQLMNFIHGGKIEKKDNREDGQHTIHVDNSSVLFDGLEKDQEVLLTHGDSVSDIAPGFKIIAKSGGIVSAIENHDLKLYGLQFHPEVDLTHNGKKMLGNFLYKVCGLEGIYTLDDREHRAVEYIRNIVGEKKVLVLVSGGVDSSVCAALLAKAIGADRVKALHIDNGFMRKDESKKVMKALEVLGLHIKIVDAGETFLNATTKIKEIVTKQLRVSVHPEEKRKIIGDTFIAVAQQAIIELGLSADDVFLAQGTLRPDLIESSSNSVSSSADVIKTHHNDTDLVRFLRDSGRVVEPLKDYHKDEVRELGKTLGLPEDLVWRQPFPGPGLAIRVLCAEQPFLDASYDTTSAQLRYLLHGDDYLSPSFHSTPSASHAPRILKPLTIEEKEKVTNMAAGLGVLEEVRKIGKNVFVTLVPVQTVGVQGDGRSYSYLVALSGEPNWSNLFFLSKLIPKIFFNVNRIVYVFGEPVKEILTDITPTYLSEDVLTQLKEADSVVNDALLKYDLVRSLSQVPVVLFPSPLGGPLGTRSIAIRTFITNDFMTGVPAIPHKTMPIEALDEMVAGIKQVKGISRVVYDLTSKPPGTTEWE